MSLTRDKQLYDASVRGDIQSLKELLKQDEVALNHYESLSSLCFNEMPLHIAVARGHVDFAKVLMQNKPDLVNELDSRLRAPLHLASANGQVEMVKLLLDVDSNVCLMEDEFGRTPLHLAAMVKGRVEVVNELVRARPEALMYPLNRMKTLMILHSYVISNGPEALEQLVKIDHTFLNSQDGEGNTILHKVVALKQLETLKYLVSSTQLVVNLKNQNNLTALEIIEQMPRDLETNEMRQVLLVNYESLNAETVLPVQSAPKNSTNDHTNPAKSVLPVSVTDAHPSSSRDNYPTNTRESWLERKRSAMLVAATVIATMAYQAGLNPPGGVWDKSDPTYINPRRENIAVVAGESIMAANYPHIYKLFWAFNTVSLVAALSIVLLLIRGSLRLRRTPFCILKQKVYMWFLTGIMWVATTTMALTYIVAFMAITPEIDNVWDTYRDIALYLIIVWLGFIGLIFLVNIFRFFICIGMKLAKYIKKSSRNVNELGERQGHSNANTTTCCMSV